MAILEAACVWRTHHHGVVVHSAAASESGQQTDSWQRHQRESDHRETSSDIGSASTCAKPKTVTNDKPAPTNCVRTWRQRSQGKAGFIPHQWARRGFVVFSDFYGHGDLEISGTTPNGWSSAVAHDTVKYATTLPFVDKDQDIAVSAVPRRQHYSRDASFWTTAPRSSRSRPCCTSAATLPSKTMKSSARYVPGKTTSAQAASKNNGEYFNYYGNRNVGIIAGKIRPVPSRRPTRRPARCCRIRTISSTITPNRS